MIVFLAKRLAWLVITLWIVFTITFFLMRFIPGGPFVTERNIPPEVERNLRARYKLDQPLHIQYLDSLAHIAVFDFGPSTRYADYSVNEIIAQGLPISVSLGILALTLAITVGLAAGILAAVRRMHLLDYGVMALATIGIAIPNFTLASLAILLFVFKYPLFPAGGWGTLHQLILPAICLGAPYAAYIARLTRTGMLEVLGQDYIRTARAKGLSTSRIIVHHALRGTLLPVVSFLGPAVAGIMTGSLVLESIFYIPGMGTHFIQAANNRDFTLAMGLVLVYTFLLYSMNLLVDIAYTLLDPRVKLR